MYPNSNLSSASCKNVFELQSPLSKAKKGFQMHRFENVGEDEYCVTGRGNVGVGWEEMDVCLRWGKKFEFTYLIINYSPKPTSFSKMKEKQ